jgi:hypothetical protein
MAEVVDAGDRPAKQKSAIRCSLGRLAVKSRLTRSGGRVALGSGVVVATGSRAA